MSVLRIDIDAATLKALDAAAAAAGKAREVFAAEALKTAVAGKKDGAKKGADGG